MNWTAPTAPAVATIRATVRTEPDENARYNIARFLGRKPADTARPVKHRAIAAHSTKRRRSAREAAVDEARPFAIQRPAVAVAPRRERRWLQRRRNRFALAHGARDLLDGPPGRRAARESARVRAKSLVMRHRSRRARNSRLCPTGVSAGWRASVAHYVRRWQTRASAGSSMRRTRRSQRSTRA